MPTKRLFLLRNGCRRRYIFIYDHRDRTTMLPRCLYDNGVPTTFLIKLCSAYFLLQATTLILSMFKYERECSYQTMEILTCFARDWPRSWPLFLRSRSGVYVCVKGVSYLRNVNHLILRDDCNII